MTWIASLVKSHIVIRASWSTFMDIIKHDIRCWTGSAVKEQSFWFKSGYSPRKAIRIINVIISFCIPLSRPAALLECWCCWSKTYLNLLKLINFKLFTYSNPIVLNILAKQIWCFYLAQDVYITCIIHTYFTIAIIPQNWYILNTLSHFMIENFWSALFTSIWTWKTWKIFYIGIESFAAKINALTLLWIFLYGI